MKKNRILVIAMALVMVLSLCLVGCNGGNDSKAIKIDLTLGDVYEIDSSMPAIYKSSDEDIAWVDDNGVIAVSGLGNATITEITATGERVFDVTTKEGEGVTKEAFSNFDDIKNHTSYIGKAFNVITGTYMEPSEVNLDSIVFDQEKFEAQDFYRYNETQYQYVGSTGNSLMELASSHNNKIAGGANASYKKYFSASFDADFSDMDKKNTSKQSLYERHSTSVEKLRIGLSANSSDYKAMLDEDFKNDLMTMNVRELIDYYGTHVIISASFGGRIDQNYVLSSTSSSDNKESLKNISASLGTEFLGFKANGKLSMSESLATEANSKNVSVQMKSTIYGGQLLDMRTLDSINKNYSAWLDSLDNEHIGMIGLVNQNSLYPLWDLCPDTDEGKARRSEIYNEFMTELGTTYNDFVGRYTRDTSEITASGAVMGEYPQTEANRVVSKELAKGKGTKVGKFDGSDVLEYEGDRYVAYKVGAGNSFGYVEGQTYYFKVEPIEWTALRGSQYGSYQFRTKKIIDAKKWMERKGLSHNYDYLNGTYNTNPDEAGNKEYSANTWRYSTYRQFLNTTFFDFALKGNAQHFKDFETYSFDYKNDWRNENVPENIEQYTTRDTVSICGYETVSGEEGATDFAKARGIDKEQNIMVSPYAYNVKPKCNTDIYSYMTARIELNMDDESVFPDSYEGMKKANKAILLNNNAKAHWGERDTDAFWGNVDTIYGVMPCVQMIP